MTDKIDISHTLPRRFQHPSPLKFILYVLFLAFFVWSFKGTEFSFKDLFEGIPHMFRLVKEMTPPNFDRIESVSLALLVTIQIAVIGAGFGIVLSFFLATCAARNLSPHPVIYHAARLIISFCRTVPNLI